MTTPINLLPYLNFKLEPKLPPLDMPDGPTWNDRVKRAEKIASIVSRVHEDLEETYLDTREALLNKILQSAPRGSRLEGTVLHVPEGSHFVFKI
jgi:hypothetical protein